MTHNKNWMAGPTAAAAAARRGLDELGGEVSSERCRLLGMRSWALSLSGDLDAAEATMRDALAMADALADPHVQGEVLNTSSWHYYHTMRRREQADACRRAAALLRSARDLGNLADALASYQSACVAIGQPNEVARTEDETRTLGERLGRFDVQYFATVSERLRDWVTTGSLDDYDALARELAAYFTGTGWMWTVEVQRAQTAIWRGRPQEALGHAKDAVSHEPVNVWTGEAWGALFLSECALGNRKTALTLFEERRDGLPGAGTLNGIGAWAALFRVVEGLATLGEGDRAAELYPLMLEAIATGTVVMHWGNHLVETVAGIAAAAGRQWDAAETHYQTALRLADEIPFISEQAEARYWYARMLVDRDEPGDRERARALLDAAIVVYRKIGMPWHTERAEALAAESSD